MKSSHVTAGGSSPTDATVLLHAQKDKTCLVVFGVTFIIAVILLPMGILGATDKLKMPAGAYDTLLVIGGAAAFIAAVSLLTYGVINPALKS